MRRRLYVLGITACVVTITPEPSAAQETQARGVWTDPSSGLIWAGKDNGKDVNWTRAGKYCRDLRLAGYSDWRLASIRELGAIYDMDAHAHVKGNLLLTGNEWSSDRQSDARGHLTAWVARFDFDAEPLFDDDDVADFLRKRALCVRDPEKQTGLEGGTALSAVTTTARSAPVMRAVLVDANYATPLRGTIGASLLLSRDDVKNSQWGDGIIVGGSVGSGGMQVWGGTAVLGGPNADIRGVVTRTWDNPHGASANSTYVGGELGFGLGWRLSVGYAKRISGPSSAGHDQVVTWSVGAEIPWFR